MPSAEAAVALVDVGKVFDGGIVALDGINLEVVRGATTALIGASGSGKTTLLRLIAGLEQPGSGMLQFNGTPRIGYVFQQAALMPWASVFENVALPMRLSSGVDAARINMALEQVGLAARADAMPHQLSGGQAMRVSIARALASQPDLLLLDEPFAALDEITRQGLCDLIVALQQQLRFTMVFVTHNLSEAVYLADTVVLLSSQPGRVAAVRSIEAPVQRDASFRASARYAHQCAALSAELAESFA